MSTIENDAQAAEALFNAIAEDGNARSTEQTLHNAVQENKPAPVQDGSQEQPETDSFTGIDPQSLPDELQPIYRSMQADYTRGKQSIAEERRAYDALSEYGGAQAALEAVQFATALSTDPNYALQVHEQLSEALTAAGLTPAQASAEASRQIDEAVTPTPGYDDDFEDNNPLKQELDSVTQRLNDLQSWKDQQEEISYQMALQSEMNRQEQQVLQAHPEWANEEDLDAIYGLAYSTGGNLEAAAQTYEGLQNRLMEQWLNKKAQVPAGITPTPSDGPANAEAPETIKSLFDPRLESLVNQRLAEEAAAGNI